MYTIIDIETTGGSPVNEKITEVAIYVHNGDEIIDEYVTLVNPEKKIPYHITSLTGISNAMVNDAPKFYEIAKKIVELTDGNIFVAHNVSFDYEFIRNEFKRLGFNFQRDKLCTVQLSRRLLPGLPSYSLGKICQALNIQIHGRHRAGGDAYATVKLFEILLSKSSEKKQKLDALAGIDKKMLHPNLDPKSISAIPEETGTYYFFNDRKELVYIGKSKNIRNRVLTHLRNYSSRKSIEMLNNTAEIDFEISGSELVALLKESHEIKQHKPVFNRAQRRSISLYGLYHYIDADGYVRFIIDKNDKREEIPLRSFSNLKSGKGFLNKVIEELALCQKLCGLYPTGGACFSHQIGVCHGACLGKEAPEVYNSRAQKLIDNHQFNHHSFYIVEEGRSADEIAVIKVEAGKYIGYGFIEQSCLNGNPHDLDPCINSFDDNRDIQQILRNYIMQHPNIKLIPF